MKTKKWNSKVKLVLSGENVLSSQLKTDESPRASHEKGICVRFVIWDFSSNFFVRENNKYYVV